MKMIYPVATLICILAVAVNIPRMRDGETVSIIAGLICGACAGFCLALWLVSRKKWLDEDRKAACERAMVCKAKEEDKFSD